MHMNLAAGTCVALLLTCSCTAVGPDYERPRVPVPDLWHESVVGSLEEGDAHLASWWTTLEDPVLEELVREASLNNRDLQVALHRIEEARGGLGLATGDFYPDFDGTGSVSRGRSSENLLKGAPAAGKTTEFYDVGVDATWELDVFGRIRRSVESADASVQATLEDYRDVLVVLFADVATTYVNVRATEERLRYAHENVARQQATLDFVTNRFETGVAPKLDVTQAQRNLATTEATIPGLEQLLAFAVHRLGVLVGHPPATLHGRLGAVDQTPTPDGALQVGLPADVIRQRPDVRRAERELAAQTARIGVATAELYPSFTLTGYYAWTSFDDSHDWLSSSSRNWRLGPSFRWNLFDGDRVRSAIGIEEARTEQLLDRYEQTVLLALEDVENSIVAFNRERVRVAALGRAVAAAEESVDLVRTLYESGVADFQNVSDAERQLLLQQDALAQSRGLVARNLISLYRSVGGGWDSDDTNAPAVDAGDAED